MHENTEKPRRLWLYASITIAVIFVIVLITRPDFRAGFTDGYDAQTSQKP